VKLVTYESTANSETGRGERRAVCATFFPLPKECRGICASWTTLFSIDQQWNG